MKASSCKAKARLLQDLTRQKLLEAFPELSPLDIKPAIMGQSGEDVKLSAAALEKIPYGIECKNLAKIAVYKFYEQAQSHTTKIQKDIPDLKINPLVVIKQNRAKTPLVIIDLDEFIRLLTASRNQNSD